MAVNASNQNIAKATPAPAPAGPLAPDSLGAQLLKEVTHWADIVGEQATMTFRAITRFPALWRQARQTYQDPDKRSAFVASFSEPSE